MLRWWTAFDDGVHATDPVIQVAADGEWESAVATPLSAGPGGATDAVDRAVSIASRDVSVEVLWDEQGYVGVRWDPDDVAGAHAVVTALFADPRLLGTVSTTLVALLGGEPGPMRLAELGAVNAWRSVGPEAVWQAGTDPAAVDVAVLLDRRPDLARCRRPVAVEFATDQPRPCWAGLTVSRPVSGGGHRVDVAALARVVGLLGGS